MRTLILGVVAGLVVAFGLLFLEGVGVMLQGTMYASSTYKVPDHPPINFFHPVFMTGIACGAIAWWLIFKRKTKGSGSATLAVLLMTVFTCSTILPFLRNNIFTHENYEQYNKNMSEMNEQTKEQIEAERLLKLKSEQSKPLQK